MEILFRLERIRYYFFGFCFVLSREFLFSPLQFSNQRKTDPLGGSDTRGIFSWRLQLVDDLRGGGSVDLPRAGPRGAGPGRAAGAPRPYGRVYSALPGPHQRHPNPGKGCGSRCTLISAPYF